MMNLLNLNKSLLFGTACLLLFVLTFSLSFASEKRLIFSNEQATTQTDGTFVIDVQDYENNIQLKFGNSIDAAIVFERVANVFKVNRSLDFNNNEIKNVRLEQSAVAPTCDTTTKGKIYFNTTNSSSYACNGTAWKQLDAVSGGGASTPFIASNPQTFSVNSTHAIQIQGENFTPTSQVTIPGFTGTINSVAVVSPTQLTINAVMPATAGNFSVVIENDGVLNTVWAGNGQNILVVEDVPTSPVTTCSAGGVQATACSTLVNATTNGTYCIDPDGTGSIAPYLVYCDMSTDGGGWSRLVRTTGNNQEFGQKTHAYNYVTATANTGIYATYANIKNFSKIMVKNTANSNFAAYNLVSPVAGESVYDLMTYCKNQTPTPANDTVWDGARVKGMTSEYSGQKYAGSLNFDYFFMCGVNESSDNDQAYMSFSNATGSSNSWGDGWRMTNQVGTLWSLQNGDYYTASNTHIGNNYSQAAAGYKGSNSGTYEVYIK